MARKTYKRRSSRKKYKPLKNTDRYNPLDFPSLPKIKPKKKKPKITKIEGDVFPKVTYKVVASGTNQITREIKADNKPRISTTAQSILTIALVMILTPLFTGGAISLGVYFGDESLLVETPDDVNGVSIYNPDCPLSTTPGSAPFSNPTSPFNYIKNIPIENQNYTLITVNSGGQSNPPRFCNGVGLSDTNLSYLFPSNLFAYHEEQSYSSIKFNMSRPTSYNSCFRIPVQTFDFSLTINGSTILDHDYQIWNPQDDCTKRPSFEIFHTYTLTEYNLLKTALDDCFNNCDIRFNIFNWETIGACPGTNYCAPQTQQLTSLYVEVYEPESISSDTVLIIAPWVLGTAYFLIALAGTALWNPIFKETKRRISNAV